MVQSGFRRQPQHTLIKGRNGTGAIPLGGVQPGETVVAVFNNGTGGNESANFESTVSIPGQLQQTSALNLSANEYWAITIG